MAIANIHLLPKDEQDRLLGRSAEEKVKEEEIKEPKKEKKK